jgi:hypothetical protein
MPTQEQAKAELERVKTNKDLNEKDFPELNMMRAAASRDDKLTQNTLAPYEHEASIRERVEEQPSRAIPYMLMPVAYRLLKAVNATDSRSDGSNEQMVYAWNGVMQGLMNRAAKKPPINTTEDHLFNAWASLLDKVSGVSAGEEKVAKMLKGEK